MESILSGIAEAPISPSAKKNAYALILKIINKWAATDTLARDYTDCNSFCGNTWLYDGLLVHLYPCSIIRATNDDDPNAGKYRWMKAQTGSALREQVLNISPLFRDLLEALGFRSRVGRPPHLRTGAPQEYFVLPDDVNLEDLSSSSQVLEAVIQSIPDQDAPPAELPHPETSSPSGSAPDGCQSTTCSPASRYATQTLSTCNSVFSLHLLWGDASVLAG